MAVLVGIDEAGFGPILGPLIVSSTVFQLPPDRLKEDWWHMLSRSVSSSTRRLAGRLLITDSKKAYSRSRGLHHLERTVLSVLRASNRHAPTLPTLLTRICPDVIPRLAAYPWYGQLEDWVLAVDDPDKAIAAKAFAQDLAAVEMTLCDVQCECLDAVHYNGLVEIVRNKSNVLFSVVCRLLKRAYDNFPEDEFQAVIDRQGGRVHYREHLQRMFPDMAITILCEGERLSSYVLSDGPRRMRLHFVVKADACCLPVALASMVSKYLRELFMACLNNYFIQRHPTLKPTAGYWQDGLRFMQDLQDRETADWPALKEKLVRLR